MTGTAPALAPQGGAPFLPTVASQRGVRRRKNFLPKLPVLLVPLLTARGPVRLDTSQLMGAPALQSWPLPEPLLFVPASIRLPLPATPTPAPPGHHRPPHCTILPLARSRAAAYLCTVPARLLGAPCRAPSRRQPGRGRCCSAHLEEQRTEALKTQDVCLSGAELGCALRNAHSGLCPGDSPNSRPLPGLCVCLSALNLCGFSELLPQGLNHAQCCRLEMG